MEKILVETSAKHIHLSQADLEALFGEGYELTKFKDLSQPGQYAAEEKVTVVGPRNEATMRVLGPVRKESQVELAATDARTLGFKAPVRESGDLEGTPGCVLKGPKGEITIEKGVIIAKRHIHFSTEDAQHFGVENGQIVSVKVETADRSLTFGDVVCRVSDKYALAMHIDTDESNAAGAPKEGEIIK
ncbi:PduL/EutD family phosphate acyltransferase [Sharpea azabuensis]|uniref:Phosphate propanoyltransferase n=2 Tax=Sharpea azabuensis TaxID=322505 RepID=A0A1H6RN12_9FIRM|nr:phosphate propanoyltransferase [Sharpea azabuensis]HAJ15143.1 phosphate propanoyltransferase [Erysipelotrichaceae bacterium]MDD6512433.1 phosphate propanoyltransferase [Sharpea azabuensis]MEE3307821.1 phosphate propanoyltransferase [Sharpea azabuensis]SEI52985.1 putative phosphotransacetylase [Sharpea azabuensis]SFD94936.1 putative phosphotransacetylase [Sharpea azabuensis]